MPTLHEMLFQSSEFLVGAELVSIRGSMAERSAVKARTLANELVDCPLIRWVSITDNAGGNPQLAPQALGKPILYAGKEVVIHLTCKDLNRNGLESEAWLLNSEGFHNVLAMTGDYPRSGNGGTAKPVFDLDSVGLISMLRKMNRGFDDHHVKTNFCIGAVTNNYKLLEGEVIPQYLKLEKKIRCGADYIINQVGFNARKARELRVYMDRHAMAQVPLIGNVFLLSPRSAQVFFEGRIPGIVVTPELLELCQKQSRSPDGGKAFFCEFAAKQMAIFRGLGYRGAYLGGSYTVATIRKIVETERGFGKDDWMQFAGEIRFAQPTEYHFYPDEDTPGRPALTPQVSSPRSSRSAIRYPLYRLSKWTHELMFTKGKGLSRLGAKIYAHSARPQQGPAPMRSIERLSKTVLFACKDCGDCSLPDTAFLCPESQCAKNQRNGPCGGTRDGHCEVEGFGECIWLRAHERLKWDGRQDELLKHDPMVQNQGLRGTSAWANFWLDRDHAAQEEPPRSSEPPRPRSIEKT
jgi:methylenetetrahydrofolate reductase (NADPH)